AHETRTLDVRSDRRAGGAGRRVQRTAGQATGGERKPTGRRPATAARCRPGSPERCGGRRPDRRRRPCGRSRPGRSGAAQGQVEGRPQDRPGVRGPPRVRPGQDPADRPAARLVSVARARAERHQPRDQPPRHLEPRHRRERDLGGPGRRHVLPGRLEQQDLHLEPGRRGRVRRRGLQDPLGRPQDPRGPRLRRRHHRQDALDVHPEHDPDRGAVPPPRVEQPVRRPEHRPGVRARLPGLDALPRRRHRQGRLAAADDRGVRPDLHVRRPHPGPDRRRGPGVHHRRRVRLGRPRPRPAPGLRVQQAHRRAELVEQHRRRAGRRPAEHAGRRDRERRPPADLRRRRRRHPRVPGPQRQEGLDVPGQQARAQHVRRHRRHEALLHARAGQLRHERARPRVLHRHRQPRERQPEGAVEGRQHRGRVPDAGRGREARLRRRRPGQAVRVRQGDGQAGLAEKHRAGRQGVAGVRRRQAVRGRRRRQGLDPQAGRQGGQDAEQREAVREARPGVRDVRVAGGRRRAGLLPGRDEAVRDRQEGPEAGVRPDPADGRGEGAGAEGRDPAGGAGRRGAAAGREQAVQRPQVRRQRAVPRRGGRRPSEVVGGSVVDPRPAAAAVRADGERGPVRRQAAARVGGRRPGDRAEEPGGRDGRRAQAGRGRRPGRPARLHPAGRRPADQGGQPGRRGEAGRHVHRPERPAPGRGRRGDGGRGVGPGPGAGVPAAAVEVRLPAGPDRQAAADVARGRRQVRRRRRPGQQGEQGPPEAVRHRFVLPGPDELRGGRHDRVHGPGGRQGEREGDRRAADGAGRRDHQPAVRAGDERDQPDAPDPRLAQRPAGPAEPVGVEARDQGVPVGREEVVPAEAAGDAGGGQGRRPRQVLAGRRGRAEGVAARAGGRHPQPQRQPRAVRRVAGRRPEVRGVLRQHPRDRQQARRPAGGGREV
ncbi:MAG: hypothetical protein AVDCRST_MAG64-4535, partial [uncultured Phycisphaerae bacterium]